MPWHKVNKWFVLQSFDMVLDRLFWNWVFFFSDSQQHKSGAIKHIAAICSCIGMHYIIFLFCLLLCGLVVVSGVVF